MSLFAIFPMLCQIQCTDICIANALQWSGDCTHENIIDKRADFNCWGGGVQEKHVEENGCMSNFVADVLKKYQCEWIGRAQSVDFKLMEVDWQQKPNEKWSSCWRSSLCSSLNGQNAQPGAHRPWSPLIVVSPPPSAAPPTTPVFSFAVVTNWGFLGFCVNKAWREEWQWKMNC